MTNGPAAIETRHLRTLFALGAAGCLTDGQLLERFATLGGDPAELAFATLVERHGPMVLRVARSALVDEHSAHDAFQATFLILARKARSLWVRDSLGPWLHAVAYRVASQTRSTEARRRLVEHKAARSESQPPRDGDRSDLSRAIHQEIERLPQPYRLAVVTCHLEGLTQHEAATRLGWPVGTLQSRLARGRERLRDRLQRRGLAPSLGILAGKFSPLPNALAVSTARAAATLQLGGTAAGMIAPAVLAMIETTTKGMIMTKLKLGAVTLAIACGLVGSGIALGLGRPALATDDQPKSGKIETLRVAPLQAPETGLNAHRLAAGSQIEPPKPPAPKSPEPELVQTIPPPVEGSNFPVLLHFHADNKGGPQLSMKAVIDSLVTEGYPIKSIDVDKSPALLERYLAPQFPEPIAKSPALRERHIVAKLPAYVVVDGSGSVLSHGWGNFSAAGLAAFYNEAAARQYTTLHGQGKPLPKLPPEAREKELPEPSLDMLPPPRPWETVVRIKLHLSEKEWGFGSGTVISSTAEESIILTCGHIFRVKDRSQPTPDQFKVPISVDLFGVLFVNRQPPMVACSEKDLPGELIDYDLTNNVGLIRIRPGRKLPASRVVPASWRPEKGMSMTTVGCSHGNDATAWSTTILDPHVAMTNPSTKESFATIKCANQPKAGRSGGGLYTTDGYLAGVCLYADPDEHVGLYAGPEAIHKLLDRNGLSRLYQAKPAEGLDPDAEPPLGKPRRPKPANRLINPDEGLLVPQPGPEPGTIRPATDRDRLDELERKLDQVLKALEDLKGVPSSDRRMPGSPTPKR